MTRTRRRVGVLAVRADPRCIAGAIAGGAARAMAAARRRADAEHTAREVVVADRAAFAVRAGVLGVAFTRAGRRTRAVSSARRGRVAKRAGRIAVVLHRALATARAVVRVRTIAVAVELRDAVTAARDRVRILAVRSVVPGHARARAAHARTDAIACSRVARKARRRDRWHHDRRGRDEERDQHEPRRRAQSCTHPAKGQSIAQHESSPVPRRWRAAERGALRAASGWCHVRSEANQEMPVRLAHARSCGRRTWHARRTGALVFASFPSNSRERERWMGHVEPCARRGGPSVMRGMR
jgi:hypothetical protein